MYGSNPQLSSQHSSNSSLCGTGGGEGLSHTPGGGVGGGFYPTPEDIIKHTDRSQSLGNIYSSIQTQPLGQYHQHQQQQSLAAGAGDVMPNMHHDPSSIVGSSTCKQSSSLHPLPPHAAPAATQCLSASQRRGIDSPSQNYQKRKQVLHGSDDVVKALVKRPRYVLYVCVCGREGGSLFVRNICLAKCMFRLHSALLSGVLIWWGGRGKWVSPRGQLALHGFSEYCPLQVPPHLPLESL